MPIYEYECTTCGVTEQLQDMDDDPLTECPKCKGKDIKKLISVSSFALQGRGWFKDGYSSSKPGGTS